MVRSRENRTMERKNEERKEQQPRKGRPYDPPSLESEHLNMETAFGTCNLTQAENCAAPQS